MPGETKWEDAFQILFPLRDPGFEIRRGGNYIYQYEYQNFQDGFAIPIGILVKGGVVEIASEHLVVYDDSLYLEQFWERFSLHSLLTAYGPPSRVWVILTTGEYYWPDSTFFTMWLFYDQRGILIMYYDTATKVDTAYQVCPNQPHFETSAPLQFSFWTQSPDNNRSLEASYTTFGGVIPGYHSLQDAAGLEIGEFYELIVQGDAGSCFETPRDIWP